MRRNRANSIDIDILKRDEEAHYRQVCEERRNGVIRAEHRARVTIEEEQTEFFAAFGSHFSQEKQQLVAMCDERDSYSARRRRCLERNYIVMLKETRAREEEARRAHQLQRMSVILEQSQSLRASLLDAKNERLQKQAHLVMERRKLIYEVREEHQAKLHYAEGGLSAWKRERYEEERLQKFENRQLRVNQKAAKLRSQRERVKEIRGGHLSPSVFLQLPPLREEKWDLELRRELENRGPPRVVQPRVQDMGILTGD